MSWPYQSAPILTLFSLQVVWSVVRSNGAVSGLANSLMRFLSPAQLMTRFKALSRITWSLKVIDCSCLGGCTFMWSSSSTYSGYLERSDTQSLGTSETIHRWRYNRRHHFYTSPCFPYDTPQCRWPKSPDTGHSSGGYPDLRHEHIYPTYPGGSALDNRRELPCPPTTSSCCVDKRLDGQRKHFWLPLRFHRVTGSLWTERLDAVSMLVLDCFICTGNHNEFELHH